MGGAASLVPRLSPSLSGDHDTRAAGTWECDKLWAAPPGPSGRYLAPSSQHVAVPSCTPTAVPPVGCRAPPLGPMRASAESPPLPSTCGRSSRRPPPSRRSERPWTRAGLGPRRGRPLVAAWAVAAAPAAAPGPGGRGPTGGSSPPRPGASQPRKDVGVPREGLGSHSRPEPSRTIVSHKEKLRPRTTQRASGSTRTYIHRASPTQPKAGPLNRGAMMSPTPFSSAQVQNPAFIARAAQEWGREAWGCRSCLALEWRLLVGKALG